MMIEITKYDKIHNFIATFFLRFYSRFDLYETRAKSDTLVTTLST